MAYNPTLWSDGDLIDAVKLNKIEDGLAAAATKADNAATSSTLENYATKTMLNNYATTASLDSYATKASLNDYATKVLLNDYATKAALNDYATTTSLNDYVSTSTLNDYFPTTASLNLDGAVLAKQAVQYLQHCPPFHIETSTNGALPHITPTGFVFAGTYYLVDSVGTVIDEFTTGQTNEEYTEYTLSYSTVTTPASGDDRANNYILVWHVNTNSNNPKLSFETSVSNRATEYALGYWNNVSKTGHFNFDYGTGMA